MNRPSHAYLAQNARVAVTRPCVHIRLFLFVGQLFLNIRNRVRASLDDWFDLSISSPLADWSSDSRRFRQCKSKSLWTERSWPPTSWRSSRSSCDRLSETGCFPCGPRSISWWFMFACKFVCVLPNEKQLKKGLLWSRLITRWLPQLILILCHQHAHVGAARPKWRISLDFAHCFGSAVHCYFYCRPRETGSGLQVFHYELSIKRERIEFDSDNREVISISQGERTWNELATVHCTAEKIALLPVAWIQLSRLSRLSRLVLERQRRKM